MADFKPGQGLDKDQKAIYDALRKSGEKLGVVAPVDHERAQKAIDANNQSEGFAKKVEDSTKSQERE